MNEVAPAHEPPGGPRDRLLPWPKVRDMTGLSRTTAWRRQKAGDFPLAVQISPGRVGWWESELTAWKASRHPRSEAPPPPRLPSRFPPTPAVRAALPPSATPAAMTPVASPHPVPTKRRRRPSCEAQIAFEF